MIPAINCEWGYVSSSCGKSLFTEMLCYCSFKRANIMHVNAFWELTLKKCKNNLYLKSGVTQSITKDSCTEYN